MAEADSKFTLYWRDGKREVVSGRTIAEAMTLAGYGGGAVRALDFHANGDNTEYKWNAAERKWQFTPQHRDQYSGQFACNEDFGRMCVCGHKLGMHGEGGFTCLNSDRRNIYGPNDPEYTEADNKPCDCAKFRQSRKKTPKAA